MADKCNELPHCDKARQMSAWVRVGIGEEKARVRQLLSDGDQSASNGIQIATPANTLSLTTNEVGREVFRTGSSQRAIVVIDLWT